MDVIFQDVHQSDNTKSSDTENPKATTSNETNEDNENLILMDTINVLSNVECSHFLNFDLKNLLISSPYGNSILKYYQKNNLLTFSLRAKLVNIIVRHLYTYIIKHRLTHSQFQLITSKILSLFPNECGSTYYIPAVPKNLSPTGRPVMARGKLVDKCRNMLYTSDDIQYVRKRKCQSENSDEVEEIILDQDIKSDVSWLKYNIEPWDEVIEKWRRTFEVRKNSKTTNFNAFLKEWAPLKHKDKAECLINIDFDLLFSDKNLKLYEGWNSFIDKILNTNKRTDTNIQNLIHNRQNGTISEDGRFINDIHLLANIVPPKGRILIETDSGRKQWKFSTIESIEAIIVHCKSPNDIGRVVEMQKQKSLNRKQSYSVQPYILTEGPSLYEIRTISIIIDCTIKYQFESVMKAFDTIFKLFHTSYMCYPVQAEHLYLLIQKAVYKIQTEFDKSIPYIQDILKVCEE
ncbi:uncharacterized protein [Temnothorax longispinosus]|uniref:uncharacterized protein isoform X1 n=1 Tax=Temnothorax longispinosus TaxID=300112 RepID=UPI003A98E93B